MSKVTLTCFYLSDSPEVMVTSLKNVVEGDNVSLNCNATGNPAPNVAWIRRSDNSLIASSGTAVLTNIRRADSGIFYCLAWNGIGANASGNVTIDILCEYLGKWKITRTEVKILIPTDGGTWVLTKNREQILIFLLDWDRRRYMKLLSVFMVVCS